MNKCPKNEEFIVKAENDGARTCLIYSARREQARLGIKEVPSGRVCRPQKYPTPPPWFTTPTGRGKRLKPVQVSVRIRSELPLI